MKVMKALARGVLVLVLVGSVAGCGNTIQGRVTAVDSDTTVSNEGVVSTGVATVVLDNGTEVQVVMDDAAMREFKASDSSRMLLSEKSSGKYEFAGMAK